MHDHKKTLRYFARRSGDLIHFTLRDAAICLCEVPLYLWPGKGTRICGICRKPAGPKRKEANDE